MRAGWSSGRWPRLDQCKIDVATRRGSRTHGHTHATEPIVPEPRARRAIRALVSPPERVECLVAEFAPVRGKVPDARDASLGAEHQTRGVWRVLGGGRVQRAHRPRDPVLTVERARMECALPA